MKKIKENDLITIIIACYNIEKYIEKCLVSISNQTYNNIEVLMIDDGSKDNTSDFLKKFEKKDNRFKYLNKVNGGLSDARNFGLKHANGSYICFIDGDDYIENDYVELLYNDIVTNKSDVSVCYFNRVYDDKVNINKISKEKYNMIKHPAAWNKMYNRKYFNTLEFKKGIWYEDLDFFSKLLLLNPKISIVEKPLYNYIQNSSSIMHTYDERIFQVYDVVEDIEKFATDNNCYDKDLLEYINVYHILIGTIYRVSFSKDYSTKNIKEISNYVNTKYNNWYLNKYVKKLPFVYRMYLICLKYRLYHLVWLVLKMFNRFLNL